MSVFLNGEKTLPEVKQIRVNDDKLHLESRILLLNYIKSISQNFPEIKIKLKNRRFLYCKFKNKKKESIFYKVYKYSRNIN